MQVADRFTAQLLAGPPAGSTEDVVARILAVQGQDRRGLRLAIRARTSGLTAADVDRALTDDRSVVITWVNRGTLHLVGRDDIRWLHALTAPTLLTGTMRRLAQEGVDPDAAERGVTAVERALTTEGPLTRGALAEHVARAGVRTEGQALIHVLALVCQRGIALRGPLAGAHHAYVLWRDWLGAPEPVDRDRALAELARRYLAGHGPATDRDLARWAGLPLRDARAGLGAIAGDLEEHPDGLVDLQRERQPIVPPPRLLGVYDPVYLGWERREVLLGEAIAPHGPFRPIALVGGRAAGTWSMPAGRVNLEPFGRLTARDAAALEHDAADVVRFLEG